MQLVISLATEKRPSHVYQVRDKKVEDIIIEAVKDGADPDKMYVVDVIEEDTVGNVLRVTWHLMHTTT